MGIKNAQKGDSKDHLRSGTSVGFDSSLRASGVMEDHSEREGFGGYVHGAMSRNALPERDFDLDNQGGPPSIGGK